MSALIAALLFLATPVASLKSSLESQQTAALGSQHHAPFDEDIALDPQLYVRKMKKVPFGRVVRTAAVQQATQQRGGPFLSPELLQRQRAIYSQVSEGQQRFAAIDAGDEVQSDLGEQRFAAVETEAEADSEMEAGRPQTEAKHKERVAEQRKKKGVDGSRSEKMTTLMAATRHRLKSALSGSVTYSKPSMTDIEYCQGCQLVLSQVVEHTTLGSSQEDIMFSLHSACHETVPIMEEVCEVLVDRDILVAQEFTAVARDPPFVCAALGLCYAELLAPAAAAKA
jgi:hypothetical protein